ncbi:DUF397 domain-containing protein [Kineosporia sp. J2-2]|uniref:DUF397 domain-containing protein n=1 Tax=Kineosporia corallincola TaxID=2835133 RepID=A0ABS5TEI0_9ACTN|nr:DUF397 domain-containing protein [Kineosporia corallincola]MBT0769485.1 DUF397 domain-containing protein [Kineosporia corallincola]
MSTDDITWIKASKSGDSGDCVEFGVTPGNTSEVLLRDSKNKQGAVLHLPLPQLAALLGGAKQGEFDHLAG